MIQKYYITYTIIMRKIQKSNRLTKQIQSYILTQIIDKQIDVSGKLSFDSNGSAILRLKGFIINLDTSEGEWNLTLNGKITATKSYNPYTKKEVKNYDSGYSVELFDENNIKVDLGSSFLTDILNSLNYNTKIA